MSEHAADPTPEALRASITHLGFTRIPPEPLEHSRREVFDLARALDAFAQARVEAAVEREREACASLASELELNMTNPAERAADAERLARLRESYDGCREVDEERRDGIGHVVFLLRLITNRDATIARIRQERVAATREAERVKYHVAGGHSEPCLLCNEPCNGFAGNPGLWPVRLGNDGWRHIKCINEELREAVALREEVDRLHEILQEGEDGLHVTDQKLLKAMDDNAALREEVGRLREALTFVEAAIRALPDEENPDAE